jgi:maltose alpha-D-glucosyltransferase/alpha-amylase
VELTLTGIDGQKVLTDLLVDGTVEISGEGRVRFDLGRYGCRWFRVSTPEMAPADSGDVS